MLFQSVILALLASAPLVTAFPGGGGKTTTLPSYPVPPASTCSAVYNTKIGETKTTVLTTKTSYVQVTSVSGKPTTIVEPCPYTSIGVSSKIVTKYTTSVKAVSKPVTTVTYVTTYKTEVGSNTYVESRPYTSVGTSYKTTTRTIPVTYVTSKASLEVCTETKKVPYTSVETKTVCTKKGYGGGY